MGGDPKPQGDKQMEEITKKDYSVQELVVAIGRISDLLHDEDIDRADRIEILEELGWAIGELSALGGAIGDDLGVDFGLMIR